MIVYKLIVFAAVSAMLVYVSRASLRSPGSHGFYRFFAWELILALLLRNIDVWFRAPFAWYQIVSWCLLVISLVPLALGVRALIARGKPVARREEEPELLAFEKTSALVTDGVYRYIRHPLYSSLLWLAWGIFFKAPDWLGALVAGAASALLVATARADEAECLRHFGEAYRDYMKRSRRFVPFLF